MSNIFCVAISENGMRLDQFIAKRCNVSRNYAQWIIDNQNVIKAGFSICKNNYKVRMNEELCVLDFHPRSSDEIIPYTYDLDIIFEDEDLIVINKSAGMTVHPGAGTKNDTLVNALVAYCGHSLPYIENDYRPGIVHRLDKDTSGIIIVAKNIKTLSALSCAMQNKQIRKEYLAVVWGFPLTNHGFLENFISRKRQNPEMMTVTHSNSYGSKLAITEYVVTQNFGDIASLLRCILHTGRTHQIRLQLSHIGHSVVGDPKYGTNSKKIRKYAKESQFICQFKRQALHAYSVTFLHPKTQKTLTISAPIPDDIQELISNFRQISEHNRAHTN